MMSNDKQLNLRLPPQGVPPLKDIPDDLVARCEDWRQAVRLCMAFCDARYSERWWAEQLGMKQGTLNVILNGRRGRRQRYLNPELFGEIQLLAGNRAIAQYFSLESRGLLNRQRFAGRSDRIEELRAELARLEQEVAA